MDWVSSILGILILLYFSNGDGNSLMILVINGRPSYPIIIGPPLGGDLIDILTRVHLLFFERLENGQGVFFLSISMDVSNSRGTRFGRIDGVHFLCWVAFSQNFLLWPMILLGRWFC